MAQSIDELSISISASCSQATKSLGNLADGLSKLSSIISSINTANIDNLASSLGNVSKACVDISTSSQAVKDLAKAVKDLSKSSSNIEGFKKAMEGVNSTANDTSKAVNFDFQSNGLVACTSTVSRLKDELILVRNEIYRVINAFANGFVDENVIDVEWREVEGVRNEMGQLLLIQKDLAQSGGTRINPINPEDLKGVKQVAEETVDSVKNLNEEGEKNSGISNKTNASVISLAQAFKFLGDAVRKTASALSKAFITFSGIPTAIGVTKKAFDKISSAVDKLTSKFTRMMKMLRLMITRMALRSVIDKAKEGLKNLIQYSEKFDASISLLWNSVRQLGNASASAISPLVNAFAPALNMLIQYLTEAINKVNQLFSALTGSSTWIKAKQLNDDYADSLDETGSSAKKLNKQLQGFDALNNLTTQDKNKGTDVKDMFEEMEIDNKYKDLADKLKSMFNFGDFYDLGIDIGKKLKDALDKIPWDDIKESARKLGKSLATLINGFINVSGLGETIGKTLAEAINTAFEFLNAFVHKLDWAGVGKFISDTLNGFFDGIDWDLIEDTFITGFSGLADTINSFIDNFKWDNLSKSLSNLVNILSNTIYTFFSKVKWVELGKKLGNELRKTILKIDWRNLGKAVGIIIQSAIDFAKSFIGQLSFKDIVKALQDFFSGVFEELNVNDAVKLFLSSLGILIATQIPSIIKAVVLGSALKKVIQSALGIAGEGIEIGSFFKPVVGIASVVGEILMVKDGIDGLIEKTKDFGVAIGEIATGVGVAVASCTLAFGFPAGTIIALIGGVIGAIAGINEAFNEIESQNATESIRRILTSEDGTPIDEVFNSATQSIKNIASGFDDIITEGSRLDETQEDIQLTVDKIIAIETSMNDSVIATTEGVTLLTEQFDLLSQSARERFGEVETVLLSAFGQGGAIAQALSDIGIDVASAQAEVTGITVEAQKRINEINDELKGLDPRSDKYIELQNELFKLSGVTTETSESLDEYAESLINLENIDYSSIIDLEGLDTGAFINMLNDLTGATKEAIDNVSVGFDEFENELTIAIETANDLGDKVKSDELSKSLNAIPDAMENVNSKISEQSLEIANTMQTDMIEKMDEVMTDAIERYNSKGFAERLWLSISGNINNAEEYAMDSVKKYKENYIDVIANEIETSFEDLGIEGAGWASSVADEIIKGFAEKSQLGETYVTIHGIKDNYSEIIKKGLEGAKKEVDSETQELGKAISDGVDKGFDKDKIVKTVGEGCQSAIDEYAKVQDSHSPSEVYKGLSKDSVDGLIKGWEENSEFLLTAVRTVANDTIDMFKGLNTKETWINTLEGVVPAFETVMESVFDTIKNVWGDITDWLNKHLKLKIDTDSEVGKAIAEALGSSTIKFGEIPKFATGGFPRNGQLFIGNENGIEMMGRMGNSNVVANNQQIVDGIASGVASANSEQNVLLREQNALLQGILNKEFGISSDAIFSSVQRSANSYYKRTGNYAF